MDDSLEQGKEQLRALLGEDMRDDILNAMTTTRVEKLEARASELAAAIIRGEPTIYTAMLRAEWYAVQAAIKAAIQSAWMSAYIREYIRETGFAPYMGKSNNDEIIARYDLQPDADGSEEDLSAYNCALSVDWRRPGGTRH